MQEDEKAARQTTTAAAGRIVATSSNVPTVGGADISGSTKAIVDDPNEVFCRSLRQDKAVVPGKSWGGMSKKEQGDWMARRCDQYFCVPNKMEGRGVYNCKPPPL
jgi:hypothetical protein